MIKTCKTEATSIPTEETGLLTVAQFCSRYQVGRTKAYELFASGTVPARQISKSMTRIRVSDAEAWAASLPIWQREEL